MKMLFCDSCVALQGPRVVVALEEKESDQQQALFKDLTQLKGHRSANASQEGAKLGGCHWAKLKSSSSGADSNSARHTVVA